MQDRYPASRHRDRESRNAPVSEAKFHGWLEQLDAIYRHYYLKYRRDGRKRALDIQSRHWQHYDQHK